MRAERLRELERNGLSGDPDALRAYLEELARRGEHESFDKAARAVIGHAPGDVLFWRSVRREGDKLVRQSEVLHLAALRSFNGDLVTTCRRNNLGSLQMTWVAKDWASKLLGPKEIREGPRCCSFCWVAFRKAANTRSAIGITPGGWLADLGKRQNRVLGMTPAACQLGEHNIVNEGLFTGCSWCRLIGARV